MKFKVGDEVRIKKNSRIFRGKFAGKAGVITDILRGDLYPYTVEFEDGRQDIFHGNELEKRQE